MTEFDRGAVRAFRFTTCDFDPATGQARLGYAFDDGPEMVETLGFPGAPFTLACYLVEGGPSKEFVRTRTLMHADPALWSRLMDVSIPSMAL